MLRTAVCTVLLSLLAPAPADACSYGIPLRTSVSPGPGAVDVPLNTRVVVLYDWLAWPATVTLRRAGGEEVSVTQVSLTEGLGLQPTAALAPDTTYEILDTLREDCVGGPCNDDDPEVISTFTTGSVEDLQPPSFTGARAPVVSFLERCESEGCCGPYVMRHWSLAWDPASDDHGIAGYAIYSGTPATFIAFKHDVGLNGAALCDGAVYGPVVHAGPRTTLVVRAVDLAGNESVGDEGVELIAPCEGEAAAPVSTARATGCAHPEVVGWLAMVSVVALGRRRSR